MRFDTIIVPRGAEARAVEAGWAPPRPPIVCIPAGGAAGESVARSAIAPCSLVLGLCGALDPALRVGDIAVYDRITAGEACYELDAELTAGCASACGCAPVGAANVARFVGGVGAKAALRAATGAAVADMEAAAVAAALARRGVRVAMVRVVSDDAVTELPALDDVYDSSGALRPAALAFALVRTPVRGARFIANALRALRALRATAARLALSRDELPAVVH